MNRKLFVGLLAVVAYVTSVHFINNGTVDPFILVALGASAWAIGLIVLEWSRV